MAHDRIEIFDDNPRSDRIKATRQPLGTQEVDNDLRADWAEATLNEFAYLTHQDTSGDLEHDKGSVISDLLCNLMHLCDREDLNFSKLISSAEGAYEDEISEEAQE